MTISRAATHGRPAVHPRVLGAAVALLLLLLLGCGTTDAPDPLSPSGPHGRVRFVNMITDTTRGRVNAILEGLPFGVNLVYGQSTPATLPAPSTAPYAAVLAGARTLVLKRTADTLTLVATIPFTVTAGQDATIYATGGSGSAAVTSIVTVDDNTVPAATSARVRLVHLAAPAGPVDVFVTASGADLAAATPTFPAVALRSAGSYVTLPAGSYQVRAVPAGTAPAARAGAVSINLASLALSGGTVQTLVTADNGTGGTPLRAFVLADR
jgi:hypothetical protein